MAIDRPASSYMRPGSPSARWLGRDAELERVRTLARVLDDYFVDPLIGLFMPGVGDVIGSLLGIYTSASRRAARCRR